MRWLLSLAVLTVGAHAELNCSADPIVLPIRDVQVLSDVKDSFMKGIAAKVGSPEQDVVLLPWAELNNTWIYDEEPYCDKTVIWNDMICRVRRGNLLKEEDSDSYQKTNNIVAAGGAPEEAAFKGSELGINKLVSTGLGGDDTLQLVNTKALKNFPIGTPRLGWDHGYTMLHPLGLGSNSTYLNAMREAGQLASRVWSIFWGRMWVDNPIDGALVLGGYDENKVIGDNYTAPLVYDDHDSPNGCWTGMKLTLSDIRVNFREGSEKSILPKNTALPVCIVPQRQLLLEAPNSWIDTFEEITDKKSIGSSMGLHWSARLFNADEVFDGDVTFHLSSGLEIRVPNDQFIVPYVEIDRNGSRTFNNSRRELLMNGVGDQPATLGRYFLTAAYLMVNHDAGTFTIWRANPSRTSKPVKVVDESTAKGCGDDGALVQPSSSPAADGNGKGEDPDSEESSGSKKTPVGAIAGGVVGGVVGLALLGFAFWFWRRRQQKQKYAPAAEMPAGEDKHQGAPPAAAAYGDYYAQKHHSVPPQEMGSEPVMEMPGNHVHEMDGGGR